MPKKKKTRKQKMLADLRHKTVKMQPPQSVQSVPQLAGEPKTEHKVHSPIQAIATSNYQYLYSDLFKTIVLTFSIIAGELVLCHLFA